MSPILTRPIREQLEHDRVIRLLQARYKRKNEVIMNPGSEQNQSVTVGNLVVYPDLLLFAEGGKKLLGTIEVETGESVNVLEARAEWGVFCKLKVPMHLYVPPSSVDAARRLCTEYNIPVAEIWTFHATFDQVRFTMIHRSPDAPVVKVSAPTKQAAKAKPVAKAKPTVKAKSKPVPKAKAKAVARPVKVSKPAQKAAKPAPLRQGFGGQAKGKPAAKKKTKPAPKKSAAKKRR